MDTAEVYYSDQYENEGVVVIADEYATINNKLGSLPKIPTALVRYSSGEDLHKKSRFRPHCNGKTAFIATVVLTVVLTLVVICTSTILGLTLGQGENVDKGHGVPNCSDQATLQNMSYWLQEDIHNYLQASQLPALEEFTMCFFFEPNPQNLLSIVSPEAQIEALISIASEDNTNAFLLGFYVPEDKPALKLTYEPDNHAFFHQLFTFWEKHRHCFIWKRQHYLKWFCDIHQPGVLDFIEQIPDNGTHSISAGSNLVLLNDQDSVGGRLDSRQMISGYISNFQMWRSALSSDEVRNLTCRAKGNLVVFEDMEIVGLEELKYDRRFACFN